jgi:hypothetical protein
VCSSGTACELPALPAIPDKIGDDVASVLLDVRRYSDAMIEYTDCLKAELAAAGGAEAPALHKSVLIQRNNHAVAEHKALTDLYAERVGPLENLRLAEYVAADSKDCLLGSSVVKTGVVNDGAVIFFARNKQAYLNVLPATCPGLEREGQFFVGNQPATGGGLSPVARGAISPNGGARGLDTPLTNRVCDQDRIFPYKEDSGRRAISCGLGRFFPISEQQALQILTPPGGPAAAPSEAAARSVP